MEDIVNSGDDRDSGSRRRLRGVGALAVALVTAGLMIGACSGKHETASSRSASPAETNPVRARNLAFAECLRQNGVPKFPDPARDGALRISPDDGIDVNGQAYKTAQDHCKALAPTGRPQEPPSGSQVPDVAKYVDCMRKNGMPKFPAPDAQGQFSGVDINAPAFKTAQTACQKFLPAGAPPPPS
jgi:hypothetical protein